MILSLNSSKFNITNNIIECKGKDTWTDHIFDVNIFYDYKTKNLIFKLKNIQNKLILTRFYNIIYVFFSTKYDNLFKIIYKDYKLFNIDYIKIKIKIEKRITLKIKRNFY